MKLRVSALALGALLLAGCGSQASAGPRNTMPSAALHAANFPIATGDTHGPAVGQAAPDCNGCHFDKTAAAPSPSFKTYTCTSCHVLLRSGIYHDNPQATFSAWHVAAGVSNFDATVAASNVVGVAPLDAACRACHPSGIAVNHAVRFILPHQDLAGTIVAKCADCHVDPADRTRLGCAQCHPHDAAATTTGHALVPDFSPTDSGLCARCHEDGKIPVAVTAHATGASGFAIGAGKHSGAAGGACLTCHPQNRANPLRTFVADFSMTSCTGCHVTVGGAAFHDDVAGLTTLHASVATFTNTVTTLGLSAACLSCHADGSTAAPVNHEQIFPRATGTAHAGISCSACHGTGLRTDLTSLQCLACHLGLDATLPTRHGFVSASTATTVNGYGILVVHTSQSSTGAPVPWTSAGCIRCHADSQVDTLASHTTSESGFGKSPHRAGGCVTCHTAARTDKPYPAVNYGSASGCATCHPNGVP